MHKTEVKRGICGFLGESAVKCVGSWSVIAHMNK